MNLRIAGMGWVTPLGRDIDPVWDRLIRGEEATAQPISDPITDKTYCAFRIPTEALKDLPPHPRLRRASAISRFAAAAGLDALAHARSTIGEIDVQRMALVFAVSNGGVVYTKRFYHSVVESGAQSASPLLFPETVFNSPASHLAAILGIAGASYTLVGDGTVGVLAIKMASDLLDNEAFDFCLVVGAEEADWLLCDAYHKWRLLKKEPPIEPFHEPPRGMILSEGAGAVLLAREGACIIASANGTFVDLAERAAIEKELPKAIVYGPKPALGESVGASAVWQIIVAAEALRTKRLPQMLRSGGQVGLSFLAVDGGSWSKAIVLSCGLNQQVAGLRLSI